MRWFRGGVTMSGGAPAVVPGLGLVEGSLSVHLASEPERLPIFRDAIAAGRLAAGYAVDDGAALVFAGSRLHSCVTSSPAARVLRVRPDGEGSVSVSEMPVQVLSDPGETGPVAAESHGVSELRALRAGRRRWD